MVSDTFRCQGERRVKSVTTSYASALPKWRALRKGGGCPVLDAADAGFAGVGHDRFSIGREPLEIVMAAKRPDFEREWS
jgi:hypothetical protein